MYNSKKFLFILTFISLISMKVDAKMIINTDFGNAKQEVNIINEQKELYISGKLPNGWIDNSDWASIKAEYIPLEEDGIKFLRINIEKIISGWCQLTYNQTLPKTNGENYYRLSIGIRNPTRVIIAIAIRMIDEPYEYIAFEKGHFTKNWQEHTFNYKAKASDKPIGLYLAIIGKGFCDIAKIKLQELTKDEIINDLKKNYKESKIKNLLRISRFPLGLQSGWSLDRDNSDNDDVIITEDEKIGISGAPTLRIEAKEEIGLWITTFNIENITDTHTASIYIQGDWEGKIIIACDKDHIKSEKIEIKKSDGWQRKKLNFTPNIIGKAHAIKIEGKGTIWIDAMQVELGDEATEYKSGLPCEVSLACPRSDASIALVQFEDENPVIRYCVSGKTENSKLKIKIINVYNEEMWIDDIPLSNNFINYGEFRYDVFMNKPYGSFRIETHVQNNAGERISAYNEIVVHRIRRPHYWMKDAPNSPFGIHTNSTTRHILMAKAIGINWTRLHDAGSKYLMWYYVEPEKDQWRFSDKEINRFRKYGMKILAELGTAPKWASFYQDVGIDHNNYFDKFYQPKDLNDYARYVRTVTERYKDIIDTYDVWNEPWNHAWWGVGYDEQKQSQHGGYLTSKNPMKDFVNLMETAYKEAKNIDEENIILGFNTTTSLSSSGNFSGEEWTSGILDNDGLNYCDIISYHDYTIEELGYPNDASEKGFNIAMGAIIRKLGEIPKPIWMTEGLSTMLKTGAGFYNYTIPYKSLENIIDTSDTICRYVVSHLGLNIQKVFLYSMHCHSYFPDEDMIQFRPLVTEEGFLHPSSTAYSNMAWHLEDTRFYRLITLVDGVYAYIFKGKDKSVAIISPRANQKEYKISVRNSAHIRDLFGNPIRDESKIEDTLIYIMYEGDVDGLIELLKQKK